MAVADSAITETYSTDRKAVDLRGDPDFTEVNFEIADEVFIKQLIVGKATFIRQHKHNYDHVSMLAIGMVRLWVDEHWMGDLMAPQPIMIKAGKRHEFLALSDSILYCIHRIHEGDDGVSIMKES